MIIVDAHLDLAYSALNYGRNLRQSVAEIRQHDRAEKAAGRVTVSFPDLQKTGVGVVFATLFAAPASSKLATVADKFVYHNTAEAHRLAMKQLDYYHQLADEEATIELVGSQTDLERVIASHAGEAPRLGIVPLMEGADAIREPEEAEMWYERGLRIIGPAWDDTRYAAGAWGAGGGLSHEGNHLLEVMADLGFILDLTHMSEQSVHEALERYEGAVVATHSNARTLVPGQRQLSDEQIGRLAERDGVIGVVLYNSFLRREHRKGDPKEQVTLDHVVAHIDHICQLLGDARHVGVGSDFDGGFGAADIPAELDTVGDLPLIAGKLRERGYDEDDVTAVMGGNWLALLGRTLP